MVPHKSKQTSRGQSCDPGLQGHLQYLSLQAPIDTQNHITLKAFSPEWLKEGEAGAHVELIAGGGIAGFDIERDDGAYSSLLMPHQFRF